MPRVDKIYNMPASLWTKHQARLGVIGQHHLRAWNASLTGGASHIHAIEYQNRRVLGVEAVCTDLGDDQQSYIKAEAITHQQPIIRPFECGPTIFRRLHLLQQFNCSNVFQVSKERSLQIEVAA